MEIVHNQYGIKKVNCEWAKEGTKFSVSQLDEVKKLAEQHEADVYEVREEWFRI